MTEAQPVAVTAADATARWAWLRAETPVTKRHAYMNCGWSGPLSNAVADAMRERVELETSLGPETGGVMNESASALSSELRAAAETLLGATPGSVAITANTTQGMNLALNGVGAGAGDVVVTTSVEHGGGIIPVYRLREASGVEMRIVPITAEDSAQTVVDRFAEAIDGRTRAVVLSEISYSTGQVLPVAEIARMAHAHEALVIADAAQTAGQAPIDVQALDVDAYAITTHKWLCGPDGMGMLYVRPERVGAIEPVMLGLGEAVQFDTAGSFALDASRVSKFEVSTRSGPLMAGALAAIRQHLDSGPEAVWERVRGLGRAALSRFERIPGVKIESSLRAETQSGLFLFSVNGVDPEVVMGRLREGGVIGRRTKNGDSLRLCFHVYNTDEEIERAAELVESCIA